MPGAPQPEPNNQPELVTTTHLHSFDPNEEKPTPRKQPLDTAPPAPPIDPPSEPPVIPPSEIDDILNKPPVRFTDDAPPGIGGMPPSLQDRYIIKEPSDSGKLPLTRRKLDTTIQSEPSDPRELYTEDLQKALRTAEILIVAAYHKLNNGQQLTADEIALLKMLGFTPGTN